MFKFNLDPLVELQLLKTNFLINSCIMNSQTKSITEGNKSRRDNKRLHPNGKIPCSLDENDRSIIKAFCEVNLQPLRSVVDLARNHCAIYCNHEGQEILLGNVEKIVYKKTFEVLQSFKLFTSRNLQPGQKPESTIVKAGTKIFTSEDFNFFWIPVPTEEGYVKVERWIVVKNTILRQVRSLMLVNEEKGIGLKEGMKRVDIVELMEPIQRKY